MPSLEQIKSVLKGISDPHLERDLIAAEVISDIQLEQDSVKIKVKLGYPAKGYRETLIDAICKAIEPIASGKQIAAEVSWKINAHKVQKGLKGLMGVKNLLAIASGKGGVGKSTVAVNLALALQAEGAKVGILDADIYGPSQPCMLGNCKHPEISQDKRMIPVISHGLQSMSMGYLMDKEDAPMVWRGPMVSSAVQQLTLETEWKDLDYLIVDLPPGTGDIQLTLTQKIPVSGAVIVTTPQDIALLDARKALNMFRKLDVPVLGIVENMSVHVCSQCGHEDHVFGQHGGRNMATQYQAPLLGSIPLDGKIREQADLGIPIVIADPNHRISAVYREIGRKVTAQLSMQAKDLGYAFPSIVVKNE